MNHSADLERILFCKFRVSATNMGDLLEYALEAIIQIIQCSI